MPDQPEHPTGGHQFGVSLAAGGEVIPGPDPTDDGGDAGNSESEQQT